MSETCSSVEAWVRKTSICSQAAVFTSETQRASAGVVVNAILAGSSILTGIAGTVVDVCLTARAAETRATAAKSTGTQIHTFTTVGTWFVATAVQSLLTVGSGKSRWASADVATGEFLLTCASIKAGIICTGHGNDFTVLPVESLRTRARVIVLQIITTAAILAGVAVTLINLQLTVCASKSRPAGASVAALSSVGAGGAISAGFVIGTVVEVLVTEEASPTLLTHTLPWL